MENDAFACGESRRTHRICGVLARVLIALAQAEAEATAEDSKTASDPQVYCRGKPPTTGKKTVAHPDDDDEDAA